MDDFEALMFKNIKASKSSIQPMSWLFPQHEII